MPEPLIQLTLIILIILVLLNLKLTLALYKIINKSSVNVNDSGPVLVGALVPRIKGRNLKNNTRALVLEDGMPAVLLFLSSKCPTCKQKLPQIEYLNKFSELAGLCLYLISMESKSRLRSFLGSSPLLDQVLLVRKKDYKKLNPALASPFYLFVDHEGRLQAFGSVGDSDWNSFVEQIVEIEERARESA